jgi:hypothetical protein
LSLAANADRWALTFTFAPPDGAPETTYLAVLASDGAALTGPVPVDPYARVAALGDGFVLVGPNLVTPMFVALDRDGRETARITEVPAELGSGAVSTLFSFSEYALGITGDTTGARVFRVEPGADGPSVAFEFELPIPAPLVFGFGEDRLLFAENPSSNATVVEWLRDDDGTWSEAWRMPLWPDTSSWLTAATWLSDQREWWGVGSFLLPDGRTQETNLARIGEDGTLLATTKIPPGSQGIAMAPRPAMFVASWPTAFTTFESDGTPAGTAELDFDSQPTLTAWNDESQRFGVLGFRRYTLVLRCDIGADATITSARSPDLAPTDLPPNEPPPTSGVCTADNPIVAVVADEGLSLSGLAIAGDAIALLVGNGIDARVIGRDGTLRKSLPLALRIAAIGGEFLTLYDDRLEALDAQGETLAEMAFPTGTVLRQLAVRGTSVLASGTSDGDRAFFSVTWNRSKRTLTLGSPHVDEGRGSVIGSDGQRVLLSESPQKVIEYAYLDGTWTTRTHEPVPTPCGSCGAAWHPAEGRWWIAGSWLIPGTPYLRGVVVKLDPATGEFTEHEIDTPTTRAGGAKIAVAPELPRGRREALLFGNRFFGTAPLERPADRWFDEWQPFVAPDPADGTWVLAIPGGTVGRINDLGAAGMSTTYLRRWVSLHCGLR